MHEDTPEFIARNIKREANAYLDSLPPPFFRALTHYAADGSYSWHCPGHSGGVAFPEEPGRPDVPPVLRREHAARRCLQRGRGTRPAARPHRSGRRLRAQRGAHLQRRSPVLRHQRYLDLEQDRLALDCRARRYRRRRPQLPQVQPARDHHVRRDPGVPDADAQQFRHHWPDPEERVFLGKHPEEDRCQPLYHRQDRQAARADDHPVDLRWHPLQRRGHQGRTGRQDRYPAFRRSLAAARRFPRLLRRLPRDRRRPPALQGVDGLLDAVDAQAAGRPLAGLADPGSGFGSAQARPRCLQRGLPDAPPRPRRSTRSSLPATWPQR